VGGAGRGVTGRVSRVASKAAPFQCSVPFNATYMEVCGIAGLKGKTWGTGALISRTRMDRQLRRIIE
jgi:hypothetical protein